MNRRLLNSILIALLAFAVMVTTACSSNDGESTAAPSTGRHATDAGSVAAPPAPPSVDAAEMGVMPPAPEAEHIMSAPAEMAASEWLSGFYDVASAVEDSFEWPERQVEPQTVSVEDRMILRTSSMDIDTLEFEDTAFAINRIVRTQGGFVETSTQWMASRSGYDRMFWYASFVIRVPVARFDETNREFNNLGQTMRFATTSEDVTMLFSDLASRLTIREEEELRFQAMLEAASELQDIIRIESQITGLRLIIDSYRRRMNEIDQLASFSTITITLREVEELEYVEEYEEEEEDDPYYGIDPYEDEPIGFIARISGAFGSSASFTTMVLENIGVFLAAIIIPAALLALPGFILFILAKRAWRRLKTVIT